MLNIEGVQGLEYRALLLSTVRTCTVEPGDSDEGSFLSSPKVSASYVCLCIRTRSGTGYTAPLVSLVMWQLICVVHASPVLYIHTYIVCVCVCTYVCTYVRAYVCVCTYVRMYVCVCTYVRTFVHMYVHICTHLCTYISLYVHILCVRTWAYLSFGDEICLCCVL